MARQRVLISSRWNSIWDMNWRANSGVLRRLKRTVEIRDGPRFVDWCLMKCHCKERTDSRRNSGDIFDVWEMFADRG